MKADRSPDVSAFLTSAAVSSIPTSIAPWCHPLCSMATEFSEWNERPHFGPGRCVAGTGRATTGGVAACGPAIRSANVVLQRELLGGIGRLNATTAVLQRARLADPLRGMWEAADVQWWWRRPRATDELALPVWFDEIGPVAAAGLTAWDDTWQADVFAVPSIVDREDVWAATLEATAGHRGKALQLLVHEDDALAGGPRHPEWVRDDRRVVGHHMDGRRPTPAGRASRWVRDRRSRDTRRIVRTR